MEENKKREELEQTEEVNKEVEENIQAEEPKEETAENVQTKGNKKKIIIGVVAVIAALAVAIGVYANSKLSKIQHEEVNEDELQISEEVEEEVADEYLNVAIFGVNAKSEKDKTVDSDAVYVASLNLTTKEVKLVPVYGNAMMKRADKAVKMKEAYAAGGAEEAIAVLNETLELNIKDYVTLNFQALVDVIDKIGGIEINVTKEEIPHINGYDQGIAKLLGKNVKEIKEEGNQVLDGCQAVGYCRIRVTDGGDVKRGSRQMEVINKVIAKLKESNFAQVNELIDIIFPQIQTNFDKTEMISYGKDAPSYTITTLPAYPRAIKPQVRKPQEEGQPQSDFEEVVEGTDCEKDVKDIHNELFGGEEK